jgi:hypothetical protein
MKGEPEQNEPDCGNGRVAGLIAACQIARHLADQQALESLLAKTRPALRERLAYELAHTEGGVITAHGSRTLFGRWRNMTPELAAVIRKFAPGVNEHLMDVYVDHHRPTWWLAWNVELLWRNEAPFSLPSMPRDIMAARAWLLEDDPAKLTTYLDIPWCRGDEYQIQKIAMVLGRAARREIK